MAHPQTRTESAFESCKHIACALIVTLLVFLLAGLIADGVVVAMRYWSV